MTIVDSVKRAPRWAWITVGGVAIGAVAVRLYQNRDAEEAEQQAGSGSTVGDIYGGSTLPTTTGGGPPGGVVVPPIVLPPASDSGLGDAFQMLGGIFTDFSGLLGTVVSGSQQNIADLINLQASNNEVWADLIASAGQSPPPVAQQPPVVTVNVPVSPPATPTPPPSSAPPSCPASFPNYNPARGPVGPASCYKNCGHDECGSNGRIRRNHGHCYQNGSRTHVSNEPTNKKC